MRVSTRENKQVVAKMETVANVPGYDGSLKASNVIQVVSEFFNSIGNAAKHEELGSVILRKRGIKDDISHGIGREKAAAFMAVPDVLKRGRTVDYRENWKGRGYDTAVVAAPIKISGEDYIAGVCVKRARGENMFYVHEVLPIKEGATPFNRAALETSVNSGGDTPSLNSILSELLYVKGVLKSSRNQTETASFKKWFGDWQNDPAHASKVVNEDGTPLVMYHGTKAENGDFTVFDYSKAVKKGGIGLKVLGKGNYFTSTPLNGSERYGSRVISAYLDIKNPFV